jgi:hypothetical protein
MTPFTLADAQAAADAWGANCGPGALAAVLGLSLDAVRPHLSGFDQKRYTNPKMMRSALDSLGVAYGWQTLGWQRPAIACLPENGLARVQWAGPWTDSGVPWAAAQRHTHWIGSRRAAAKPSCLVEVFDINCICVGGWVPLAEWSQSVVPWLLEQCEPKATGG